MCEFFEAFKVLLENKLNQQWGDKFFVEFTSSPKHEQLIVHSQDYRGLIQVILRDNYLYVGGQYNRFGDFDFFDVVPDELAYLVCFKAGSELVKHMTEFG